MALPINKIYFDSKHKKSDSVSNSNFKVKLNETILMPKGAVFKICDIAIPHSWTTIITGVNDKFYFYVSNTASIDIRPQTGHIATLEAKNYTGSDLVIELQSKMNLEYDNGVPFSVTYNAFKQSISISTSISNMTFKIMTENDIGLSIQPAYYNSSNPNDINTDMLKLNRGNAPLNSNLNPFVSQVINLQPVRNIYLQSSNLGNHNTVDLIGRRDILKKIPVTAPWNSMIFDNVAYDDYLDCSRQTLQTLEFRLTDTHNNEIELNGGYVSFSIIFDVIDP